MSAPSVTTNRHERMHVPMGLGQQALGLRDLHAAELVAPTEKRRITGAGGATQLPDSHADLSLLEEADDLFFGEYALPHVRHSSGG